MRKFLLIGSFLGLVSINAQTTNVYSFGFDSAFPSDWVSTNQSSPVGASTWTKANYTTPLTNAIFGSGNTTTVPVGQAGGNNSFALVNFNSTTGAGTISNWLLTSAVNVKDGDIVSFYTRKGTDGTTDYPDRLELRYSTAATTVNPSGSSGLGSFTNTGVTVNPSLVAGFVYPKVWTKYSFTITGVGSTAIPVKFAFRYYVTDGGPSGNNSDLIGIDTFSVDRPTTLSTNDVSLTSKEVSVYPNPTTDYLIIKSERKISNIEIFDISGKSVKAKLEGDRVNVKNLNAGSYLINIESNGNKISEKFIKK